MHAELASLTQVMNAGRLAEVETRCTALLGAHPGDPRLLCMLGRVQRLQDNLAPARENLLAAYARAPRAAQVLSELGYLALAVDNHGIAAKYFGELVALHPQVTDAWFNLGVALRHEAQHQQAVQALERCLALSTTGLDQVHTELGTAHLMQRREQRAVEHFDQALAINPDYAPALHGLGMARAAFGDFDAAAAFFRRAMQIDPELIDAYQQLVSVRRFESPEDPDIAAMERIAGDPERNAYTRETLHYSLGKVYDDCAEYERAFAHFRDANALNRQRLPAFSRAALSRTVDELIAVFNDDTSLAYHSDNTLPIIVCGMPRSGTTLVEQVLAAHDSIDAGGEHVYVERATRGPLAPYPASLPDQPATKLEAFAHGYVAHLEAYRNEGDHVTDKYPANLFHLGLLHALFPHLRIVYCRRSRLDNILSIYFQNMPAGHFYANDLDDLDFYYREHERIMTHWLASIGDAILTVDYEAFVGDFEAGARRLIEFCGLPWQAQCLDHRSRSGAVATLSLWQVRQPVYSSSVERWRHYKDHLPAHLLD